MPNVPLAPGDVVADDFDFDAARARLSAQADEGHPPAWQPEEGDELCGVVVAVNPAVHTAYGDVPVVTLQGPNGGRRSVWLHHAVLRRAFVRADVQLGELVLIRYVGRVEPEGGGNPYADYRVAVDRPSPTGAPPWQRIAALHEDPLEGTAMTHVPVDVDEVRQHVPAAAGAGELQAGDAPLGQAPKPAPADDDIPF